MHTDALNACYGVQFDWRGALRPVCRRRHGETFQPPSRAPRHVVERQSDPPAG
jgi:hypothetical protein